MYSMSSIYHGLRAPLAKKVMQVLDHCAIYFMIAGTYTPILLSAVRPLYPALAWTAFGVEWGLTALAVTLTAIDLRQFLVIAGLLFDQGIRWSIGKAELASSMPHTDIAGIAAYVELAYMNDARPVLYGIGAKRRYFHCAFHVFVLLGSVLHFLAVYLFAL